MPIWFWVVGLQAIAVTDHDTLAALPLVRKAAFGTSLEVLSGVEITCTFQEREVHLLGYFVREVMAGGTPLEPENGVENSGLLPVSVRLSR